MHGTKILTEADRLMTVCNSCRYCEGLCAVFPAMEMRRAFSDGDLNYLANLCHSCGACYTDCQFSPPHEFDVNVPKTLAAARKYDADLVTVSGGVSCNQELRRQLRQACSGEGVAFKSAEPWLCTDNAAMIAFAALLRFQAGFHSQVTEDIDPNLTLAL